MATTHPALAAEFHPTKNGDITPGEIAAGTAKKLWWRCSSDPSHEWQSIGNNRVNGNGCPVCDTRGFTLPQVRLFVKDLVESGQYAAMSPAERYALFERNGLIAGHSIKTKRTEFVKGFTSGSFDEEDLQDFAEGKPSPLDEMVEGDATAENYAERESDSADEVGEASDSEILESQNDPVDPAGLPAVSASKILDVAENLLTDADSETVEFFVASTVHKLWRKAYDPEQLDEVREATSVSERRSTAEAPRKQFRAELDAAESMELPAGWDFRINGKLIQPNLMQRHVATLLRDKKRLGNWSGTGAGKTLSAVLGSRLIDAKVTVVICPKPTIGGWKDTIENAFSDARVETRMLTPKWKNGKGPRWLLLNFEMLQQASSEPDVAELLDQLGVDLDLVVVDEVHKVKQRNPDVESKRRQVLNGLLTAGLEANPDLHVLGMTATPVINNLAEAVSLIEMVTGVDHSDLPTKINIPNAMTVHRKLSVLGVRWMPAYELATTITPEIDVTDRRDELIIAGAEDSSLPLERVLLDAKMSTIIDSIDPDGTLIYAQFVEGMIPEIGAAAEAAGYKVGYYYGPNKSGLKPFLDREVDVLVGSSCISTGVDGLQHRTSKLIVACAPWTSADYEQLVGRLVRTGQTEQVRIVFPVCVIPDEESEDGKGWSYDRMRRGRIEWKKSVADCAVDGVVPAGALRTVKQAKDDSIAWLKRLDQTGTTTISRKRIDVKLSRKKVEVERRGTAYGDFAKMNGRWNSAKSGTTHERLVENPEEWKQYHEHFRKARKTWTWVPANELAKRIGKGSKNLEVVDFGCGEDTLGEKLRAKGMTVSSFDHVALSDNVFALDVAEGVPVDDDSVDIAVFSLSLMGKNNGDYIREAARVLAYDGTIFIVETTKRFGSSEEIEQRMTALGFKDIKVERHGENDQFTLIEARRDDAEPGEGVNLIGSKQK